MRIPSLLCGFIAVALAGPVLAQESSVRNQLDTLGRAMENQGWSQVNADMLGALKDDSNTEWSVFLVKDVNYQLHGVCDNDCTDLDLALFDQNNNLVSRDYGSDDRPMVSARPAWTGNFTLRIVMADCQIAPCNYGVRTFAR